MVLTTHAQSMSETAEARARWCANADVANSIQWAAAELRALLVAYGNLTVLPGDGDHAFLRQFERLAHALACHHSGADCTACAHGAHGQTVCGECMTARAAHGVVP